MKFSKVAGICKTRKTIVIYDDDSNGLQWLGDGIGLYLLDGMLQLTPEKCLRLFDIPEGKHSDFTCIQKPLPEGIDFTNDGRVKHEDFEPQTITVGWAESTYNIFRDGREMWAVNSMYLAPLAEYMKYLTYHKRSMSHGGFALGVNVGLELQAIICPSLLHHYDDFVESITKYAEAFMLMGKKYKTVAAESQASEIKHGETVQVGLVEHTL